MAQDAPLRVYDEGGGSEPCQLPWNPNAAVACGAIVPELVAVTVVPDWLTVAFQKPVTFWPAG